MFTDQAPKHTAMTKLIDRMLDRYHDAMDTISDQELRELEERVLAMQRRPTLSNMRRLKAWEPGSFVRRAEVEPQFRDHRSVKWMAESVASQAMVELFQYDWILMDLEPGSDEPPIYLYMMLGSDSIRYSKLTIEDLRHYLARILKVSDPHMLQLRGELRGENLQISSETERCGHTVARLLEAATSRFGSRNILGVLMSTALLADHRVCDALFFQNLDSRPRGQQLL
jgi:Mg2+ and Co2+ transporter CorA